jgi:hypothetical protein
MTRVTRLLGTLRARLIIGYVIVVALLAGLWAWSLYGPLTQAGVEQQWRDLVTVAWIRASVVRYMWVCDSSGATTTTNSDNLNEPDPLKRDIVGFDCDAWAYDLQRPDEPYEARGPHPTGVGIDRETQERVFDEGVVVPIPTLPAVSMVSLVALLVYMLNG